MGYTHYWGGPDATPEQWRRVVDRARKALTLSDVPVAAECDTPDEPPELTDAYIRFNGIGEDGHETFYLERIGPVCRFDFCKTARKPYDVLVTAVLWIAHEEYGLRVTRAGTMEPDGLPAGSLPIRPVVPRYVDDWAAGHALAARTKGGQ